MTIPSWKCHKVVKADKIVGWRHAKGTPVNTMFVDLECGYSALVSLSYYAEDRIGGYYVEYADGYQSWSPAKAFEEGYTKIEE